VSRSNIYYMLVASLPHMPRYFEVERVPINRIRLEERLRMLRPEDAAVVKQVQDFLLWDRQSRDQSDEEVMRRYDVLMATVTNSLARHLVSFRMDVRTIMSALRRRRRGLPPPAGVGQWLEHIRRHWTVPHFNLERQHSWVGEAERLLDRGEPLEVERLLLDATWREWARLANHYHFSFETILLYLARWEIVDRWVRLDWELGREKFEKLVTEALDAHGHLYD
jgi:hypothetical protein